VIRLFYRKLILRFLCRTAKRRIKEVERLGLSLGVAVRDRTPLFSSVHMGLFNDMGYPSDADGVKVGPICWNCPIGFTFYIAEQPYFGLGVELRRQVLCIRQMQGVPGAKPLRNLKDWPELLVFACTVYAQKHGLKEVRIYKADQDISFEYPFVETKNGQSQKDADDAHRSRMRHRYDGTARKLKFKKKKRYYVWEVPQPQPQ
jgi:hypothetical protein